ncbi:MAG: Ppx/GppA phosphatase family protein [Pseudomonadota bacterium]
MPRPRPRLAALDLGTNNCRLLIADPLEGGFRIVDSFSRIVRLGEGLVRTNRLSERAMSRTLSALKVCARLMDRYNVDLRRCVTTEACRRAENGGEFLRRVRRVTGIKLELLPHEREAGLAMLGCLPLIDEDADQLMMLDIGGGSTEIMWLDRDDPSFGKEPGHSFSIPVGVVTLSEAFGRNLSSQCYSQMVARVLDMMSATQGVALSFMRSDRYLQMLGTSGTVTTLAAVHLGLKRYDRRKVDGVSLSYEAIASVGRHLRLLDNQARAAHPCIGYGRADLVIAGCAILDAVHQVWPVEQLHVADRGVREGILNELVGRSLRQSLLRQPQ